MVKKRTLHFVNLPSGTVSQHWKKRRANEVLKRLRKKGLKAKIVSKAKKWVF